MEEENSITFIYVQCTMRTAPTSMDSTGTASDYNIRNAAGSGDCTGAPGFADATRVAATFSIIRQDSLTAGQVNSVRFNNANGFLGFSAEL